METEHVYDIEVTDLVKRYKKLVAIDHLSLQVKQQEIFGLLGPNGSGKSTLINCILSLLRYDHGEIKIFGQPMHPNARDIKSRIGFVPQDVALYDELNVAENIDAFCGLYIADRSKRHRFVDEAIEFVQLQDFRKFKPKQLSGGLKRRLNMACGIAHKPKLLFLDEPTVAVDPQSRNQILEGIKTLNQAGTTVIYTTHYMEEVEFLCDRLMILDHGQAIAEGNLHEVLAMSSLEETIEIISYNLPEALLNQYAADPDILTSNYENGKWTLMVKRGANKMLPLMHNLEEAGINPLSVASKRPSLNDVFLEITGKELRDHA